MKKAMMILVAVAATTAVQAASLNWGANWVYPSDASGNFNYGLYSSGTTAGTAWLILTDGNLTGMTVDNAGVITVGTGETVVQTKTVNSQYPSGTISVFEADNNKKYALVVYDSKANRYGVSPIYTLTGVKDSPPTDPDPVSFVNDGGISGEGTYFIANLTPVPEPASMALFGIGAAALALRRRFAKKS